MFDLAKDDDEGDVQAEAQAQNAQNGAVEISAADYDASDDRREDEEKRLRANVKDDSVDVDMAEEEEEEEEEDVDDMFALAMGEKKVKRVKKVLVCIHSTRLQAGD
jgi:serine/threonine-protein kinase PRP4